MPYTETARHDRYTIEVYCQHCGTYLNTQVGIEPSPSEPAAFQSWRATVKK